MSVSRRYCVGIAAVRNWVFAGVTAPGGALRLILGKGQDVGPVLGQCRQKVSGSGAFGRQPLILR
ncbi:MAG: hypothetical protein OQK00_01325 [Rhodobacteraceae bacterium]|nr:hypothetical protein [Paracoccaceae bacterium]